MAGVSDAVREIDAKNRELWNRWALPALSEDRIEALGLAKLKPLNENEIVDIIRNLGGIELPDPAQYVDMTRTRFRKHFEAEGFVFPRGASFNNYHFDFKANFDYVYFGDDAIFAHAYF